MTSFQYRIFLGPTQMSTVASNTSKAVTWTTRLLTSRGPLLKPKPSWPTSHPTLWRHQTWTLTDKNVSSNVTATRWTQFTECRSWEARRPSKSARSIETFRSVQSLTLQRVKARGPMISKEPCRIDGESFSSLLLMSCAKSEHLHTLTRI